ncbi:MAG: ORF6N domain-containing protein [Aliarcobacter sp.]|jgi:hypothetical protein|nr:ORF6N domain-containing protein [Aliarcobacter sp.]
MKESNENSLIIDNMNIQNKIYAIRGFQVMLDSDLAQLYGVETKRINEAVKNNPDKFPDDFYFEATDDELENLRSKISTSSWGGNRYSPKLFTEQGIYMLATVLKSKVATNITVMIIRTFANMRRLIKSNDFYSHQLKELEKRQLIYEIKSDDKFDKIFNALENKQLHPTNGIFYNGQIFDAYVFISDLIKIANESIVLIDNYVDDTTLTLFSKNQNIKIQIFTSTISKQLQLDINKYNQQYNNLEVKITKNFHDRFIILDDCDVYHIGASLKDLGNKIFAFSKISIDCNDILKRL